MRAFRIAYDGRPFHGFQRQPDVETVEGVILRALSDLGITEESGETPPGYAAAGRTDRGVSAVAQVVAFEAPDWLTPRALNGELPADVRAWAAAEAPPDFHATRDAAWREYVYHLHAPEDAVNDERLREALWAMEGTHDFHNLTASSDEETVRTVTETHAIRDDEFVELRIRAPGFLHEMVRRIATLVDRTARGTAPASVERYLSEERLSGPEGIGPAPAEPLVLVGVDYPTLDFEADEAAAESRRSVFDSRRVRAATRARVTRQVRDGDG